MQITNIEVWQLRMELGEAYTVAYGQFERVENVFLRVDTNSTLCGYGCAAPELAVTGATAADVFAVLKERVASELVGKDPLRWRRHTENLKTKLLVGRPSAACAVETALLDIVGKVARQPLWQLLGGFRDRIRTSVTIGILDEQQTIEHARYWVAQGFRCLKLKGGREVESDIARVLKTREVVGPDIELRFDANQGYTAATAQQFVVGTRKAKVTSLEQPTPKDEPDLLGRVTQEVAIPIMADESLLTLGDAFLIARRKLADTVNIKLMKVGGIGEAMQIGAVARAANLPVMVGCMDESALGIAAGLQFALAHPSVTMADLDGHIGLKGDPFAGSVLLKDGTLFGRRDPGLGAYPPSP